MPTAQDLHNLGRELRMRREALGLKSLREFARRVDVSPQHLSQLERGYVNPKRGLVVPSDEVLEKLAAGLDVPLSRLHALLGRLNDQPYPVFDDPKAVLLAERYSRLPGYARTLLLDVLADIEAMVRKQEQSASPEG